ncbi:MAG: HD domain-containing protein [Blautia sp.]|nr:HD domain-containing protein [Blautia sp.]
MKLKRLQELEGGEILAREIKTSDFQVVLPEGAILRKEYIERLKELGITEIYITEKAAEIKETAILRSDIEISIREKVKEILERHTYHHNDELIELKKAADSIIAVILEENRVVEKIFDIRERSTDIYEHSISVCSMAILTALKLKIEIGRIHEIGIGCLLHDIGLRYSASDYFNRDIYTLNQWELTEYRKHPIYGYSSLKDETWISELSKTIILQHHERLNGFGFPLKMKELPLECQIVNICDLFDEMICGIASQRVKVHEAIENLKSSKNVLFDEKVVNAFLSFAAVYPAGTQVMTNEGEQALVLSQNTNFQDRPVIRILKDKDGNDVKGEVIKDMVKVNNIFIEKTIDSK